MRYAGLDIGSRSIELVVLEDSKLVVKKQADSGFDPLAQAKKLLKGVEHNYMVATGYGRSLAEVHLDADTVTEIKAYAVGARFLFPEVRAILDIGGQDCKAIALSNEGRVLKFEMNDKCAAGTGKFLEVMAQTLGYDLYELGQEALRSRKNIKINSMCTVFAESEVTSLINSGHDRCDIAMGLHRSIARRNIGMLKRVMREGPILFAGGVAKNACMVQLIKEAFDCDVLVPTDPQMVGALGAAIIARKSIRNEKIRVKI